MANAQQKRFKSEALGMGAVLIIVALIGGIYLWKEDARVESKRFTSSVSKRYDAGSLHYVAPELILYQSQKTIKTGLKEVWGVTPADHGVIYACGEGGIKRFNAEGNETLFIPIDKEVRFISVVGNDQIYAAVGNKIDIYDTSGAKTRTIQAKEWESVNAFAFKDNLLFVADGTRRVIWKCKSDGTVISEFASQKTDKKNGLIIPGKFLDIAFGKDGLLYVTNPGRHNVNAYTMGGKLELVIGHPSFKHAGFSGCCNPVSMAVMKSGNIMTAEKGIARVKILDKDGKLIGVVAAPVDFRANKHAFIVDVVENEQGDVYALNEGTKEIFVYTKKKG